MNAASRTVIATFITVWQVQICVPYSFAQDSSQSSNSNAKIIPAAPDAVGGGNPFQGLGRSDESAPSRRSQFESTPGPGSLGSSNPIPGSFNPNVPPDLPPAPSTLDPIDMQRAEEDKARELDARKKATEKEKQNAERPAGAPADTPLKRAVLEMQLKNYDKSLSHLDDILLTDPRNAEAHYLKAVVYVLTRKYDAAAREYRLTLENNPSQALSQKARTGLMKLAR